MSNIISPSELITQLANPSLCIADCRFDLTNPGKGINEYAVSHIPGAVYLSVNGHLATVVSDHGGRHPLPDVEVMAELFESLGIISGETPVVVYDDSGGPYASRLWWMLRYLGHDQVRILDGGFSAYIAEGGQTTAEIRKRKQGRFIPEIRRWMNVSMEEVRCLAEKSVVIDSRASERHRGENEVIDIKAGHIPNTLNMYWMDCLDENLRMLPWAELCKRFERLSPETVFYCGSGVTACLNILSMEEAGYPLPRLYAGSWSDWISYPENPIACGE